MLPVFCCCCCHCLCHVSAHCPWWHGCGTVLLVAPSASVGLGQSTAAHALAALQHRVIHLSFVSTPLCPRESPHSDLWLFWIPLPGVEYLGSHHGGPTGLLQIASFLHFAGSGYGQITCTILLVGTCCKSVSTLSQSQCSLFAIICSHAWVHNAQVWHIVPPGIAMSEVVMTTLLIFFWLWPSILLPTKLSSVYTWELHQFLVIHWCHLLTVVHTC